MGCTLPDGVRSRWPAGRGDGAVELTAGRRTALRALIGGGVLLAASPAAALPEPAHPLMRRRYLVGPFGQLHIRYAEGGGQGTPLVLLHQSPLSGRMFDRIVPLLAKGRTVIAIDAPGYGESDRPPERPTLAAYGDAIIDTLAGAFGPRFDLLGYHTGAAIAAELAARRPERVRRLILISMPYFSAERRAELLGQLAAKAPEADDGSHLPPLWASTFKVRPEDQSREDAARLVAEKLRVGRHGEWALQSVMEVDFDPILPRITAPTLVITPHDGLEAASTAAAALIKGAHVHDLPDHAYGLFDAAPEVVAGVIDEAIGK